MNYTPSELRELERDAAELLRRYGLVHTINGLTVPEIIQLMKEDDDGE